MNQIKPLLQAGAQFEMYGSPYEVTFVKNDEVRLAPLSGGAIRHLKFKALDTLMTSNQIVIKHLPRDVDAVAHESMRTLREAQLASFNRKRHYVHGVVARYPKSPCAQQKIAAARKELAEQIDDQDPPGASTIASWIQRWLRGGRVDEALLPRPKPSRADFSGLDRDVLEMINASIEQVFLTRHRNSVSAVHADIAIRIANHNAESAEALQMPSIHIVRKIINKIDTYERDVRRHGKTYANRRHRAVGRSILAREPLELCMADGQHMDIMLVSEPTDGTPSKVLGRPFLTVILDVRTRCILAAFISLQPFCGGTLLKAMTEAVVESPGRPRGIMSTLIVDNGADYQDSGFLRFLSNLGITLEICGPRMPNGKAHVERFFRTINEDLIHKLPGTTFSNPTERGDYRSQDLAHLTLDALRSTVQTWIDEIYHPRAHRSLGRAPIDVWNEEINA